MTPISTSFAPISAPSLDLPVKTNSSSEFSDLLTGSIRNVEAQGAQSQEAVQRFLSGESDDIHKVALASQKAELSAELFMQVRNKVVSAYQEIMRMQM